MFAKGLRRISEVAKKANADMFIRETLCPKSANNNINSRLTATPPTNDKPPRKLIKTKITKLNSRHFT